LSTAKYTNILATTLWDDGLVTHYGGAPVTDAFGELYRSAEALVGSDAASLFALPETRFSKVKQAKTTTWYSDRGGVFRSFDVLSDEEQRAARAALSQQIETLLERADGRTRELLSVALNIPSINDVYFNGETVVLTNWGRQPAGSAGQPLPPSASALASFLPAGFALVSSFGAAAAEGASVDAGSGTSSAASEAEEDNGAAPEGGSGRGAGTADADPGETPQPASATAPQAAHVAAASPHHVNVPQEVSVRSAGRHIAVGILLSVYVCLLLFIVYMLWPGNLLYPESRMARLTDAGAIAAQDDANRVYIEQINLIQAALGADICAIPDGARLDQIAGLPTLPLSARPSDRLGAAPLGQGAPSAPGELPRQGDERPGTAQPDESGGLDPAEAPGSGTDASMPSTASMDGVVDRLERGTVFILGATTNGVSMGSGIVIDNRHVLTNLHVVEDSPSTGLQVTNKHILGTIPARVIARSQNSDIASNDFALLELMREIDLPPLPISTRIEQLDGVIAAGYPSFVVQSDPGFVAAFREGDMSRLSEVSMAMYRGEVTTIQAGQSGNTVLAHSATISKGNSGGPLVDVCGRVVGINTYTRTDSRDTSLRLNFALSAEDVVRFLQTHNMAVEAQTTRCSPAPSPPAQAMPSQPVPALPGSEGPVAQGDPAQPAAPGATPIEAPGSTPDPAPSLPVPPGDASLLTVPDEVEAGR